MRGSEGSSASSGSGAPRRVRALAEKAVAPHAAAIANGDERTDGFPRQVCDDL
ncbi:hypothetical protein OG866_09445 [Streptomyces sp. NBC_00663]|uniref:hypothetical protein n=1 Tax=Streptomyces sp. NBC_00663 TaxID=2975801 RepID=UPI002E36DF92|nr:hypothetical protein [Streptomyces sp. NBC_00663]